MTESHDFLNHNINRLMLDKSEWFSAILKERMSDSTTELTPAEGRIFGTLRGRRLTVSEIARLRGVSRQSVHRIVSDLVERGFLRLEQAEDSKRDKVVVMTARGQELREQVGDVLRAVEEEIANVIGRDRLEALREVLMADWSNDEDKSKREGE